MDKNIADRTLALIDGHVLIRDYDTQEVLLDKHNAINYENFSVAIVSLLSGTVDTGTGAGFEIIQMKFGNGGTVIDATGNVEYRTTNTDTKLGDLYNQTFFKIVDVDDAGNTDVSNNKVEIQTYAGQPYSDVVVTATLDYAEPSGQNTTDNTTSMNGDFTFDEIALQTAASTRLSHICFHPIEKSANRKIQVIYTIRIQAGS